MGTVSAYLYLGLVFSSLLCDYLALLKKCEQWDLPPAEKIELLVPLSHSPFPDYASRATLDPQRGRATDGSNRSPGGEQPDLH